MRLTRGGHSTHNLRARLPLGRRRVQPLLAATGYGESVMLENSAAQ
jgi:hypothetical protein